MLEPLTNPEPVVYQLRVVLRGISPLIWRRLLVRSDSTIADLHTWPCIKVDTVGEVGQPASGC